MASLADQAGPNIIFGLLATPVTLAETRDERQQRRWQARRLHP